MLPFFCIHIVAKDILFCQVTLRLWFLWMVEFYGCDLHNILRYQISQLFLVGQWVFLGRGSTTNRFSNSKCSPLLLKTVLFAFSGKPSCSNWHHAERPTSRNSLQTYHSSAHRGSQVWNLWTQQLDKTNSRTLRFMEWFMEEPLSYACAFNVLLQQFIHTPHSQCQSPNCECGVSSPLNWRISNKIQLITMKATVSQVLKCFPKANKK